MILIMEDPPSNTINDGFYQHVGDELKLFHALSFGHINTIKRLILHKRVSVQCIDTRNGWSTLFYSIRFGYNELVEFLLDNGHEDSGISKDILSNTALMVAIIFDNEKAFELYLERFPQSVDIKNKFGESALLLAAKKGNNYFIRRLLEYGANIDEPDNDGNTPLHHAAAWAHVETISFLIRRGCKFAHLNKDGWSAVDFSYSTIVGEHLQSSAIQIVEVKKRSNSRNRRATGSGKENEGINAIEE